MKKTIKNAEGFGMPDRQDENYKVHVICGTHWDREWRFTAEQSKLRLAEVVDTVIETMENHPDYHHFMLDGGTVVLEDYMTVRPQNRERLKKLIESGRTPVVSWYTLPETNLVMGEALIRNLLIGRGISKEFGGPMEAGYTATGYGQPAQLPQIYRGFGIESAIFYRGTNKQQVPPVCWWESPDGSKVLFVRGFDEVTRANWTYFAIKPIVDGTDGDQLKSLGYTYDPRDVPVHMADSELYELPFKGLKENMTVPADDVILREKYEIFRKQAYKQAIGRVVLGLDMEDNGCPWTGQVELIERLNTVLNDTEIVQSSMDELLDAVRQEVDGVELHTARGEFRYTLAEYGWNGLYGMTQSSRMKMKILNERAETNLVLTAEPLAAFASALGSTYPRINLDQAWLALLKNHSHDSICGAGIDDVHKDMEYRFRQVCTVSQEVGKRAVESIWKTIDHSAFDADTQTLTVFNTLPFRRDGVREFVLDLPGEQYGTEGYQRMPVGYPHPYLFDILDEDGAKIEYDFADIQDISMGMENESGGASKVKVRRHRILMQVELPSMGYRSFGIVKREPNYVAAPQPTAGRVCIAWSGGLLENDHLKVSIHSNGTFDLTDKGSGKIYAGMHYFEDRVASGDWPHLDPSGIKDSVVTSLGLNAVITMEEATSQRGIYRIEMNLPVPKKAEGAWYRSTDTVDIPITVWLTLRRDSKRLDIRTRIDNRAKDHRLCVMMPTRIQTDTVSVEAPFAVENRNFLPRDVGDNSEADYRYQPMQNFVDMSDGKAGLAVLNQGLREYAVWDDPNRTIGLTLLRTYRAYINANTDMTPEEFAKYPETHCPGVLEFEYAIYPHTGDWQDGDVMTEAYDFKTPVRAIQGPAKAGEQPPSQSFVTIQPEGKVMLSALCQSEDGQGTLLRIWNTTDEPVDAKIETTMGFTAARKVRMAEGGEGEELTVVNGAFAVPMRKAEIVTIRLEP